jgi:hypothetical protein
MLVRIFVVKAGAIALLDEVVLELIAAVVYLSDQLLQGVLHRQNHDYVVILAINSVIEYFNFLVQFVFEKILQLLDRLTCFGLSLLTGEQEICFQGPIAFVEKCDLVMQAAD